MIIRLIVFFFFALVLAGQGAWGNASYQYDALNNLLAKTIGSRNVSLQYDGQNRLSTAQDSADGVFRSYAYDNRGNVTGDGNHTFGRKMIHRIIF